MSNVDVEDVRFLDSTGFEQTARDDATVQKAIDEAEKEANSTFSKRMTNLPNIEGDRDIFIANLAAHILVLRQGGEAQSESQEGGNVSYDVGQSAEAVMDYLSMTRFGRRAASHVRNTESIGIVTDRL